MDIQKVQYSNESSGILFLSSKVKDSDLLNIKDVSFDSKAKVPEKTGMKTYIAEMWSVWPDALYQVSKGKLGFSEYVVTLPTKWVIFNFLSFLV